MKSFRAIDSANEQMVARFLDERFYLPPLFEKAERVFDVQEQRKGKDIIVSSSRLGLMDAIIDEKNTAHHVNKNIPTFAFELSFFARNGVEIEGWLTDDTKETEYYLLIWPFARLVEPVSKPPEFKEITKLNYLLVKRSDVLRLLLDKGFDRKSLLQKAKEMRSIVRVYADNDKYKPADRDAYGFYFMYTCYLVEKPVNVVIPRKKLEEIAILSGCCE